MNTHHFQLADRPFAAIASGEKTIESRLYDEKRQAVQLGDIITFTNREKNQTVSVRVLGLLRYKTFHDLFSHNNLEKFGGHKSAARLEHLYSVAEQNQHRVLGIEFELL